MTAKELFEQIGFETVYETTYVYEDMTIKFKNNYLEILIPTKPKSNYWSLMNSSTEFKRLIIKRDGLKAIFEHCKELGWLDE